MSSCRVENSGGGSSGGRTIRLSFFELPNANSEHTTSQSSYTLDPKPQNGVGLT